MQGWSHPRLALLSGGVGLGLAGCSIPSFPYHCLAWLHFCKSRGCCPAWLWLNFGDKPADGTAGLHVFPSQVHGGGTHGGKKCRGECRHSEELAKSLKGVEEGS